MTYRVASEIKGDVCAGTRADLNRDSSRKVFHPHLVCSWTLDPASHRLSCAWAPPAAGSNVAFLSPRTTTTTLIARFAKVGAQFSDCETAL